MADDIQITAGSGTAVATDDIDGKHYQRIKLIHGADGTNAGDVASGNPLPVTISGAATVANQTTLNSSIGATDETVAASDTATAGLNGLIKRLNQRITTLIGLFPSSLSGAGRLLTDVVGTVSVSNSSITVAQTTAASLNCTEANSNSINGKLPALANGKLDIRPLAGGTDTVSISGTIPVSGTFYQASHPNLWDSNDNQSSAQTNTVLKAAPGSGLSLYITDLIVSNGATAGDVRLVQDPSGTPANKTPKLYFAVNGGATFSFETPIRIAANKAVGYTSTTVTTHSIMILGFTAP